MSEWLNYSLKSLVTGQARKVDFDFYLKTDTARAVTREMIEELDLSNQEVIVIAEMIDELIMKLKADRNPPHPNSLYQLKDEEEAEESMKSDISADYYLPFSSNENAAIEASREEEAESMNSYLDSCSMMSTIYNLSISDNDYPEDLKTELNLIESQFNQSFQDLLKLKEDAIENAKRKWISKKQKGVNIS